MQRVRFLMHAVSRFADYSKVFGAEALWEWYRDVRWFMKHPEYMPECTPLRIKLRCWYHRTLNSVLAVFVQRYVPAYGVLQDRFTGEVFIWGDEWDRIGGGR